MCVCVCVCVCVHALCVYVSVYLCLWNCLCAPGADPFGFPTLVRPWDDGSNSMANAKRRLRAAFEFFSKLGLKYWTFHDR